MLVVFIFCYDLASVKNPRWKGMEVRVTIWNAWRSAMIASALGLSLVVVAVAIWCVCPPPNSVRLLGLYMQLPLPALAAATVYGHGGGRLFALGLIPLAISAWVCGMVAILNGFVINLY